MYVADFTENEWVSNSSALKNTGNSVISKWYLSFPLENAISKSEYVTILLGTTGGGFGRTIPIGIFGILILSGITNELFGGLIMHVLLGIFKKFIILATLLLIASTFLLIVS